MNKLRLASIFALVFAAASAAHADPTRIAALAGTVEIQGETEGKWVAAVVGAEVPEGGAVRTSGDGRAELLYPDGTHVWMKENSSVTIETQRSLLSRLSVAWGSIKARIPHLSSNRRMEFKTSTAVAAVRGTELVITQDKGGKYDLNVLFGNVDLRLTGIPKNFSVPQGHGYGADGSGKLGTTRLLTKGEEVRGLENWHPGMTPEDRVKGIQNSEEKRQEVHNYVNQEKNRQDAIRELVNRAKDYDMEAGRIMNDVHGNLVRVEQLLLRPDAQTVQVLDLVQRPSYKYNDSQFSSMADANAYIGAGSIAAGGVAQMNRLDVLEAKMTFNSNLPQQMGAWPSYFKDNSPQTLTTVFANMSAVPTLQTSGDIFELAFFGQRNQTTGDLNTNLYMGRLSVGNGCVSTSDCVAAMTDFTNPARKFDGFGQSGHTMEQTIPGQLAEYVATPYLQFQAAGNPVSIITPPPNPTVYVVQNNFVIDNNGSIRSVSDFTSSNSTPFTILANSGFESIMQIKKASINGGPDLTVTGDFNDTAVVDRLATSIDLVVIPDLPLAALTQIALSGNNFKTQ
jgi:hypothetical protein